MPEETSGKNEHEERQVLLYAQELRQLRETERALRQQLEITQKALEQTRTQELVILADLKSAYEAEQARRSELQDAYFSTIKVLAAAVETRDDYTGGHIERVRGYSRTLGQELGLDQEMLLRLEVGAILHDIGKIGISDTILQKVGHLDPPEWILMKQHPVIGVNLLKNVAFLSLAAEVVGSHHEKWDGTGYPLGLKGEAIPITARIAAVADAFDAMTTDRVYRVKKDIQEAITELQRCAGTHFDPAVIDAFMKVWRTGAIFVGRG